MQYLCLIYLDEAADWPALAGAAGPQRRGPAVQAAGTLDSPRCAVTLRLRGGRVALESGPAADAPEQLAGFVLIDAGDLDEALELAARLPAARSGSIEVRPVRHACRNPLLPLD